MKFETGIGWAEHYGRRAIRCIADALDGRPDESANRSVNAAARHAECAAHWGRLTLQVQGYTRRQRAAVSRSRADRRRLDMLAHPDHYTRAGLLEYYADLPHVAKHGRTSARYIASSIVDTFERRRARAFVWKPRIRERLAIYRHTRRTVTVRALA